jgi:adenylosuccinate synthase
MAGRLIAVVGGQYGSEGKGAVAGYLSATSDAPFMGIRVAGPNAGHTVIGKGPNGEESYAWRLRSIPVNAVTAPESDLIIAAGSEIDMEVFNRELSELDKAGYQASSRIIVDDQATILEPRHHDIETSTYKEAALL